MMKNAQIIAAWDSILPDAAAETRIRSAVLAYGEKKRFRKWHRYLIPIAACLLLIAAGYRFRLTRPLHAELDNGMRITYHATQNGISEAMYAYDFKGHRYDVGTKCGFIQANVEFSLRNPEIKDEMLEYIKALNENMDEMLDYE